MSRSYFLHVQGAKKIATIDRFDKLIGNVVPDESSPDLNELRKLVDIKTSHISYSNRLSLDIRTGMTPFPSLQSLIVRTKKVIDYAPLVYAKPQQHWQFASFAKDF